MKYGFLVIVLAVTGCGGGGTPTGMESAVAPRDSSVAMDSSRPPPPPPGDSGAPPPPMDSGAPPPTGCSAQNGSASVVDTCLGDTICLCPGGDLFCDGTGTCSVAFGRRYTIAVSELTLPDRKPDGTCWDAACGAPDPYVVFSVDGVELGRTPAASDLLTVVYDPLPAVDATVAAGSTIRLDVFDEDISADDPAFACVATATGALLRSRDLSCEGVLGQMTAIIVP